MNKNKAIKVVLMVFVLMTTFSLLQKRTNGGIVYGYGYNGSVISVNPLTTTNTSPQLSGVYTGGPYSGIYVIIQASDKSKSFWGSFANVNNDGTWNLPAGTITPALPLGTYDVIAYTIKDNIDTTYDVTTNELRVTADFSKIDISSEIDNQEARINFDNFAGITQYRISKDDNFDGDKWEDMNDHASMSLNGQSGKIKYYVQFKDMAGFESEVFKENVNYTPNRYIKNSRSRLSNGQTLIQSGKKFSKDSTVWLYFSDVNGNFDSKNPKKIKVQTSHSGSFSVNYVVNKAAGKYKWHAVDEKTGKVTKNISYTIKK